MRALLDTGSDDCIFPEAIAPRIGVDLSQAQAHTLTPIGGSPSVIRYCEVMLRLADGVEFREWRAWVGFSSLRMRYPVLGFAGCLQFFTVTFHGDREVVELAVNGLYPGT